MTQAVINVNPEALAAGEAALRAELAALDGLQITSAEMSQAIGAVLIEQLRVLDVMQEQRDSVTKPLHEGWKKTCGLFATGLELQGKICRALKDALGVWAVQVVQLREAATAEARAALTAGDVPAIERALTVVNTHAPAAKGVSTSLVWRVKRVVPNLMLGWGAETELYWSPDMSKVHAEAERQGVKGEHPPVIPGVIFEREADVTGRRK